MYLNADKGNKEHRTKCVCKAIHLYHLFFLRLTRASNAASDILLMEVISQPRAFPLGMAIFFLQQEKQNFNQSPKAGWICHQYGGERLHGGI